jgi:hypothetical protein
MQTGLPEKKPPKPNGHCEAFPSGRPSCAYEEPFVSLPPGIRDLLTEPDRLISYDQISGVRLTWQEEARHITSWLIDMWYERDHIYEAISKSRLASKQFGDFDEKWIRNMVDGLWTKSEEESGNAPPSLQLDPIFSPDPWEILSGKRIFSGGPEEITWAITDILEARTGLLQSGKPHGTKSLIWLCALLHCVTTRLVWGKFKVTDAVRNVVFVETEDSVRLVKRRLRGLCKGLGISFPPPGFHIVCPGPFNLVKEGEEKLTEIIKEKHADIMVLSTLQGLIPGLDYTQQKDMGPVNAIFVRLQRLCAIVLLTHSPQDEGKKRAAGTVTQEANYQSHMHFEKNASGDEVITTVKFDSKETSADSTFKLRVVIEKVTHADGEIYTQVRNVQYVEKDKGGRPATESSVKQQALDLRIKGMSLRKIEEKLDVSKTTLQRWFKGDE